MLNRRAYTEMDLMRLEKLSPLLSLSIRHKNRVLRKYMEKLVSAVTYSRLNHLEFKNYLKILGDELRYHKKELEELANEARGKEQKSTDISRTLNFSETGEKMLNLSIVENMEVSNTSLKGNIKKNAIEIKLLREYLNSL